MQMQLTKLIGNKNEKYYLWKYENDYFIYSPNVKKCITEV